CFVPASRILGCSPPTNSHFLSGEVELTSTVKLLLVPSDVNLRIERLTWSATKRLPAPSKAKSPLTQDANALCVPSGLNLIILWPRSSDSKRLPERSKTMLLVSKPKPPTVDKSFANVLRVPSDVNLKIECSRSATNRLPLSSKAMPEGLNPVAKVLFFPSGVNLRIEWLSWSDTKRL